MDTFEDSKEDSAEDEDEDEDKEPAGKSASPAKESSDWDDLDKTTATTTTTTRSDTRSAAMAENNRKYRARLRSPWACSLATLSCSAVALLLLGLIVQSFLSRQLDPKGCAMSYMRAAFAKFTDFDTEHTRFASKYSLYLYREGGIDEDTRVGRDDEHYGRFGTDKNRSKVYPSSSFREMQAAISKSVQLLPRQLTIFTMCCSTTRMH